MAGSQLVCSKLARTQASKVETHQGGRREAVEEALSRQITVLLYQTQPRFDVLEGRENSLGELEVGGVVRGGSHLSLRGVTHTTSYISSRVLVSLPDFLYEVCRLNTTGSRMEGTGQRSPRKRDFELKLNAA